MSEVFIWKKTEKSRSKGEVWRESRHQMKGLWQPHKQYFKDDVKKKKDDTVCVNGNKMQGSWWEEDIVILTSV